MPHFLTLTNELLGLHVKGQRRTTQFFRYKFHGFMKAEIVLQLFVGILLLWEMFCSLFLFFIITWSILYYFQSWPKHQHHNTPPLHVTIKLSKIIVSVIPGLSKLIYDVLLKHSRSQLKVSLWRRGAITTLLTGDTSHEARVERAFHIISSCKTGKFWMCTQY